MVLSESNMDYGRNSPWVFVDPDEIRAVLGRNLGHSMMGRDLMGLFSKLRKDKNSTAAQYVECWEQQGFVYLGS